MVVQWLRIRLPMQGTLVWSLVLEDPVCHRAAEPVLHERSHCIEKPAHCSKEFPLLTTATESPHTAAKTQRSQKSVKKEKRYDRVSLVI